MYCMRHVNPNILAKFYCSLICVVCLLGWARNVSKTAKDPFNRLVRKAGRMIGEDLRDVDTLSFVHQARSTVINHYMTT